MLLVPAVQTFISYFFFPRKMLDLDVCVVPQATLLTNLTDDAIA